MNENNADMKKKTIYLALPLLLAFVMVALASLPAESVAALGCRNRGLWAVFIGLISGLMALGFGVSAIAGRLRNTPSGEQILAMLLYSLPLILLLMFA